MKRWTCAKCGSKWPAYVTVDAFRNHRNANKVHPNEACAP